MQRSYSSIETKASAVLFSTIAHHNYPTGPRVELLKAHDIIPASPKPDPEPVKTQDQAENKSQDSSAPSRVIKRGHSASPGVIDISSDEDEVSIAAYPHRPVAQALPPGPGLSDQKPARKVVKTERVKKEKGKETMVNRKSLGDDVIDLT